MDDMNDFRSWAHISRYYEQLVAMVGMTQGCELKALDAMSSLKPRIILTTRDIVSSSLKML